MLPYIDMHCDTLGLTLEGGAQALFENDGMLDLRRMRESGQEAQFFAIFFPPEKWMKGRGDEELYSLLRGNLAAALESHADIIAPALSAADIEKNHTAGKMSAVLTLEDGRIAGGRLESLERLHRDGVRAIALTWNDENCFGYPNSGDAGKMALGLTDFGKEAVGAMNSLGILIDVSHLSDGGFYDVAALTKKPFAATHSNARALCPHRRNLTDDMIRRLADAGGVMGLNFCPAFLPRDVSKPESTAELIALHARHIANVGGEDVLALGSDFDGIGRDIEVCGPTKTHLLFDALRRRGFTPRQMEKLASGNVLRVMRDAIG